MAIDAEKYPAIAKMESVQGESQCVGSLLEASLAKVKEEQARLELA